QPPDQTPAYESGIEPTWHAVMCPDAMRKAQSRHPRQLRRMNVIVPVDHILGTANCVSGWDGPYTSYRRSAGSYGQVVVMPAVAAVPPKLMDVGLAYVIHMLGFLGIEHVSNRIGDGTVGRRSASSYGQVAVMPAVAAVPPKLMDVVILAPVIHMLGALGIEHVSRHPEYASAVCEALCEGSARGSGQIVVMPAVAVPPKL